MRAWLWWTVGLMALVTTYVLVRGLWMGIWWATAGAILLYAAMGYALIDYEVARWRRQKWEEDEKHGEAD